ncbi:MAG: methyltransferase domain-containing protein [Myxococcota bacterium]
MTIGSEASRSGAEQELRASWESNAAAWTAAVREGTIASRRLATDDAILDAIARLAPRRVLDLGCGEGWLTRILADRGVEVLGVDASAALIEAAARAPAQTSGKIAVQTPTETPARTRPPRYLHADYAALDRSVTGGPFDLVVANFALLGESIGPSMAAVVGVLEPGGSMLIQTLHHWAAGPPYRDGWRREDFLAFSLNASSSWTPMPWYFRTLGSWSACLHRAGFSVVAITAPAHPQTAQPLSLLLEARENHQ